MEAHVLTEDKHGIAIVVVSCQAIALCNAAYVVDVSGC